MFLRFNIILISAFILIIKAYNNKKTKCLRVFVIKISNGLYLFNTISLSKTDIFSITLRKLSFSSMSRKVERKVLIMLYFEKKHSIKGCYKNLIHFSSNNFTVYKYTLVKHGVYKRFNASSGWIYSVVITKNTCKIRFNSIFNFESKIPTTQIIDKQNI